MDVSRRILVLDISISETSISERMEYNVLMGRLQKASHQDVPLVSFVNSADYELSSDEGGLDMQSSFYVLSESKSKMLEDEIIICFQEECG
ncbi:unnamed protein product [Triticum turgidum subsp. durum]|uniref:Uncharacterized protein n=1 Tax=Triticum turgidum subsp. durum TaxID=4567 RepID=A0A9R1NLC7_TRITD|nr:unnamed protein product [Triticum turgidum subsp. durum]